jgi:hypothetical protein
MTLTTKYSQINPLIKLNNTIFPIFIPIQTIDSLKVN